MLLNHNHQISRNHHFQMNTSQDTKKTENTFPFDIKQLEDENTTYTYVPNLNKTEVHMQDGKPCGKSYKDSSAVSQKCPSTQP